MLRAIPTDRYSYPHGQCRRFPDVILIQHPDKDRQGKKLLTYLCCQCGCGGLPAWGRCQLVGHLQQVRNKQECFIFFIIDTNSTWECRKKVIGYPARALRALELLLADGTPTSGRGEDFLSRQPDFFTETAVTPERKVEKSFPRWEINRHVEG